MRLIDAYARLKELGSPVIRTSDLMALLRVDKVHASTLLARLEKTGQIARIKRGLWVFPGKIDPLALAEHLTHPFPAYISLQSALFYHGMISQVPETVYAVSLARTRIYRTPQGIFSIHHMSPDFFFGFTSLPSGCKMATPEKTLLDFFYLSPAKSNLFRSLPEVDLPASFRMQTARRMIGRAGRSRRITFLEKRFADFIGRHSVGKPG
ncbi:MAG: type IV toxin-antitoxin system AbiEi family antitoxin domain-containing protein [Acidobacteria bacterium]|jgi:predicted transcriptional regulator of viral defense system|nr:type IV toxin-antitoxin system AbiEi family antitoxin domain-containing protein [Acidobacteriota bacterium]